MCTNMSEEAMVNELLSPELHEVRAGGDEGQTGDARSGIAEDGESKQSLNHGRHEVVRLVATGEEDVPQGTFATFQERQRQRYFQPRTHEAVDEFEFGSRRSSRRMSRKSSRMTRHSSKFSRRTSEATLEASSEGDAVELEDNPKQSREHTCLLIICRSQTSFESLSTRSPFVCKILSATFVLPTQMSLTQVASHYLHDGLGSVVDASSLPQARHSSHVQSHISDSRRFGTLAYVTHTLQQRMQDCIAGDFTYDFAREFCTSVRFAQFLEMVIRLSRQAFKERQRKKLAYAGALDTLKKLRELGCVLDRHLRTVRVSLQLRVDEADETAKRVSSLTASRHAAQERLQKIARRQQVLETKIAAVDAMFAPDFAKANSSVEHALRDLYRLDDHCYTDLWNYVHPPPSLTRTLELMHTVVAYLSWLDREEAAQTSSPSPRSIERSSGLNIDSPRNDSLQLVAIEEDPSITGDMPVEEQLGARADPSVMRVRHRGLQDFDALRRVVATKDLLPQLSAWPTRRRMPAWLASVIKHFSADPECSQAALRQIAPVVAAMAAWLSGRLECHDVLVQMEAKCASMGDLLRQMADMQEDLQEATQGFARVEADLVKLTAKHTEIVEKRDEQMKHQSQLQEQLRRVQFISSAFTTRHREYEICLKDLDSSEGIPSIWGGILCVATLSVYGSPFNPTIRSKLMSEARSVLQQCHIELPAHFHADDYFAKYLPKTFVNLAKECWQDKYLYESVCALELQTGRCAIVLDPFQETLNWLRRVHAKRYPPRPCLVVAESGETKKPSDPRSERDRLPWNIACEGEGHAGLLEVSESEEGDGGEESAESTGDGDDESGFVVIPGNLPPVKILSHVRSCMQENKALVIQLQALDQIRGFISTLLVLVHSADSCVSLRSPDASARLWVKSQNKTEDSKKKPEDSKYGATRTSFIDKKKSEATKTKAPSVESELPPQVQLFALLQQLRCDLALPYRRFRLYVLVPEVPWNSLIVSVLRAECADLAWSVPSQLWSLCNIVSLDTRPVHPVHIFLPMFAEARSFGAARAAELEQRKRIQLSTRLQVTENILLHLMASPDGAELDGQVFYRAIKRRSDRADQFARSLASISHAACMSSEDRQNRSLAGTVAVVLCAMFGWGQLRKGIIGRDSYKDLRTVNSYASKLDTTVGGFPMTAAVLREMLLHQLRVADRPDRAVAALIELVMQTASPLQATILKVCLTLEGGLLHDERLADTWENLLRVAGGASERMKFHGEHVATKKHARRHAKKDKNDSIEAGAELATASSSSDGSDESSDGSESGEENASAPDGESDGSGEGTSSEGSVESIAVTVGRSAMLNEEPDEDTEDSVNSGDDGYPVATVEKKDADSDSSRSGSSSDKGKTVSVDILGSVNCDGPAIRLIEDFCSNIDQTYPRESSHIESPQQQLRRVPASIPFVIVFDALPLVVKCVRELGFAVSFESAEVSEQGSLVDVWKSIFQNGPTWIFLDLAYVSNFVMLLDNLQAFRVYASGKKSKISDMASRLVLYSSSEVAEVPTYILAQCLCIQNPLYFFGILINAQTPAEIRRSAPTSTTSLVRHMTHMHPLVTAYPISVHSEDCKEIVNTFQEALPVETLQRELAAYTTTAQVQQWADHEFVLPATTWTRRIAIRSMLFHCFSPSIVRQEEHEAKDTVHFVAGRLAKMLQQAALTMGKLTVDSPFWLRAAVRRTIRGLRVARSDLTSCHNVLRGDAHWNEHLFAVYTAVAHGRAIWAGCCPTVTWIQSLQSNMDHLEELCSESGEQMRIRMSSLTDMMSFISTYWIGSDVSFTYHLRLEPPNPRYRLVPEKRTVQSKMASSVVFGEIEGLRLFGSTEEITSAYEHEQDLPPMVLRLVSGPAPKGNDWYECPLIAVRADAYGADFVGKPLGHAMIKTGVGAAKCALRGVRIVSYA